MLQSSLTPHYEPRRLMNYVRAARPDQQLIVGVGLRCDQRERLPMKRAGTSMASHAVTVFAVSEAVRAFGKREHQQEKRSRKRRRMFAVAEFAREDGVGGVGLDPQRGGMRRDRR